MNNKRRLEILEGVLHKLYFARVTCSNSRVVDILNLIDAYCYADNGSNGMASEKEIRKRKDEMLLKLEDK